MALTECEISQRSRAGDADADADGQTSALRVGHADAGRRHAARVDGAGAGTSRAGVSTARRSRGGFRLGSWPGSWPGSTALVGTATSSTRRPVVPSLPLGGSVRIVVLVATVSRIPMVGSVGDASFWITTCVDVCFSLRRLRTGHQSDEANHKKQPYQLLQCQINSHHEAIRLTYNQCTD